MRKIGLYKQGCNEWNILGKIFDKSVSKKERKGVEDNHESSHVGLETMDKRETRGRARGRKAEDV